MGERSPRAGDHGRFQRRSWRRTVSLETCLWISEETNCLTVCCRLKALWEITLVLCVCRGGEARPRWFHLLQCSGWKSCSDWWRLEHNARLLRRHSYCKSISLIVSIVSFVQHKVYPSIHDDDTAADEALRFVWFLKSAPVSRNCQNFPKSTAKKTPTSQ